VALVASEEATVYYTRDRFTRDRPTSWEVGMLDDRCLRLVPQYKERVWGGQRLRPGAAAIGEAWVVFEGNVIAGGPDAGRTLGALSAQYGAALLGRQAVPQTGHRFPLLIKLLDTTAWLSVQVHPDDQVARRLAGPHHFGKTEAWQVLAARPEAQIICGFAAAPARDELAALLSAGALLAHLRFLPVATGDTVLIPAGTLHALGPGLLIYEVQQTSDLTYRVYDWDRPAAAGRALHLTEALAAIDPAATGSVRPGRQPPQEERQIVARCAYFELEALTTTAAATFDTGGESFHALTAVEGRARVMGRGWAEPLAAGETIVVPAAVGPYRVEPTERLRLLRAGVPPPARSDSPS
jgi:mannose-6-phosphate isomerase